LKLIKSYKALKILACVVVVGIGELLLGCVDHVGMIL